MAKFLVLDDELQHLWLEFAFLTDRFSNSAVARNSFFVSILKDHLKEKVSEWKYIKEKLFEIKLRRIKEGEIK